MQAEPEGAAGATSTGATVETVDGGVWYTSLAPGARRLFRGRHYRRLRLEHDVVTVTTRRGGVVFMAPTRALRVSGVRNGLLLQVLVDDPDSRTHVFEFRPRRHAAGRALADALR
jgi:hypothetical protein